MPEWSRVAGRIRVPLGFAFAVLYFWLARPMWHSLAIGVVLIVPGLLIRAMASGHVRKNEALATSGPYAYTRNPLYLGSLLIGIGFAAAARSWWVAVVLVVMAAFRRVSIRHPRNMLTAMRMVPAASKNRMDEQQGSRQTRDKCLHR